MVEEHKFRSDLYYRLDVFPLTVPPLRARRGDIPRLVHYFAQKYAMQLNREIDEISAAAMEALANYDWPGNIRELQHLIERSVILTSGRVLHVAIPQPTQTGVMQSGSRDEESEREEVLQALVESGGMVGGTHGAAARLGMPRTTLQARMKKLNIKREYC
jgi:formate hydrogenlyase transcriptional activator